MPTISRCALETWWKRKGVLFKNTEWNEKLRCCMCGAWDVSTAAKHHVMDPAHWQSLLAGDKTWQVLTVSWPLPRLATTLGFRCAFVNSFGGNIALCLYIVLTGLSVLSPDLGVFWSGRGVWPANLGASCKSPVPAQCYIWCLHTRTRLFFLQSQQS